MGFNDRARERNENRHVTASYDDGGPVLQRRHLMKQACNALNGGKLIAGHIISRESERRTELQCLAPVAQVR